MALSDPIGDMITRVRNALARGKKRVRAPHSVMRERVLDVLQREGFVKGYKVEEIRPQIKEIDIELKYFEGFPAIKEITRTSKPGRRVYTTVTDMPRVCNGLGVAVISTQKGVLADHEARAQNVGGEVLFKVI
ncbi:30S ribosomal protein S8 [Alphaproteobacteria bacterium]|nr:30S ribosomal protein S8 [Alphaproteobacteria bacterium]